VVLRGERVALRPLVADDLAAVYAALQEREVARWWGVFDAEKVREELLDASDTTAFAIEVDGALAGVVTASEEVDPDYRHAGIDIFLAEAYQDRGYGSEAIRVLARHLFEERGHHRLTIDPAVANETTPPRSPATRMSGSARSASCATTRRARTAPGTTAC
jgi:aminoglycoside 6'-N-acetyltransferase